ncbi:MAG: NAD(P)H-dependent oxidoreductase [Lentisphaerae bacterium]|nr:NAD(P)H-dependent oxidoreductase [Lentisphaerota bacterium]
MKILAICGSPRGNKSQTKVLAEEVLKAAQAQGAAVDCVDLSAARIEFCQACETCHRCGDCVHNDDVKTILARMLEADGLILASPVYLSQISAQLKAVLDRSSHFVHCLRLMGKYLAAVTTSGGEDGAEVHAYLRHYANIVGAQYVGSVNAQSPFKPADLAKAAALGQTLMEAIQTKRQYPEQVDDIAAFKQHFRKLITLRKDAWPYEYEYWRDQDWL